ncbi:MAG: aminoglycoside phosphotransferase family protein [Chloroflexus aggregans]|uniref:Aminoglycoside phosphotransferase family protein n=1 Tax=Chloroflexus aggregans TaxID=152260 RepID=A0A2J6X4H5_9CHLR|nr:MAG: aminoglycoside phosphotransferase family protein [Chloroflexus aggregans]
MIISDFRHLNQTVSPAATELGEAWQRTLSRLGDYTAIVVRALNLRPQAATLYRQTERHVLVRLTLPTEHVVLRISPEDDLAAHVAFFRGMALEGIPGARIIQRDLSKAAVPFAYTLESFVAGQTADTLHDDHLLYSIARQAGRALRRLHRQGMPGAGRPTISGRWPRLSWRHVLLAIGQRLASPPIPQLIFQTEEVAILQAIVHNPLLDCATPVLIHGNFGPQAVRCTVGGQYVHLEALEEPGWFISGDGLFDVALGMCAHLPAAWREGLYEGYCSAGVLHDSERERLQMLRLLASAWSACDHYARGLPHEADLEEAQRLIRAITVADAKCLSAQ